MMDLASTSSPARRGLDVGERDLLDGHGRLFEAHAARARRSTSSSARYRCVYSSQKPGVLKNSRASRAARPRSRSPLRARGRGDVGRLTVDVALARRHLEQLRSVATRYWRTSSASWPPSSRRRRDDDHRTGMAHDDAVATSPSARDDEHELVDREEPDVDEGPASRCGTDAALTRRHSHRGAGALVDGKGSRGRRPRRGNLLPPRRRRTAGAGGRDGS